MQGKAWIWAVVLLGTIIGLVVFFWPDSKVTNFPSKNQGPIVFFGDSLVEGVGARPGNDLPSQLARQLGQQVENFGVAGDTTTDGLARTDAVESLRPKLVILLLGGNDFLQKKDRQETARNLTTLTKRFQATGAVVLVLGVRSGVLSGGSDELFEAIAKETGAAYERDVLQGVFGNPALMSDAIHPNDAGYAKISERLLPVVQQLMSGQ